MKAWSFFALGLAGWVLLTGAGRAAEPVKLKIVLAGDSTVTDVAGWAPGFRLAFTPAVECINQAASGRSSKSYRDEGFWAKVLATKADYVLIQFGTNDVPGKGPARETIAGTTYRDLMTRYVTEAERQGIKPVLVTPLAHRQFGTDGSLAADGVEPYVAVVREVAAQRGVPLIDLYAESRGLGARLGREQSDLLGRFIPDAHGVINPDNTHLGRLGALRLGGWVAQELSRVVPELAADLDPEPPAAGPVVESEDIRAMARAGMADAGLFHLQLKSGLPAESGEIERIRRKIEVVHEYGLTACVEVGGSRVAEKDLKKVIEIAVRRVHADELLFEDSNFALKPDQLCDYAKSLNRRLAVGFEVKGLLSPNQIESKAVSLQRLVGHSDFLVFDTAEAMDSLIASYKLARSLGMTAVENHPPADELSAAVDMVYNYQKPVADNGSLAGPLLLGGDRNFTPIYEFYRRYDQRYFTNTTPIAAALTTALPAGPSLTTEAPVTTGAEAYRRDSSRETVVHFINFASGNAVPAFKTQVRLPYVGPVKSVKLLSPGQSESVSLLFETADGRVTFTVPQLRTYALVAIAQ